MNKKIIFFTGKDCPSCKIIKTKLYAMMSQDKINDIPVQEINIDEITGARRASEYFISSIPACVYLEDEKPMSTFIGSSCIEKLRDEGII